MALREVFARFTTQFNGTQLQRGNAQVSGLIGNLGGAFTALRTLGVAVAGLAIVRVIRGWVEAVHEFVQSMAEAGDELDKTSRSLGINTGALQEWRHAANLSGVNATALTGAIRRLSANMGTAVITPTSAAAIEFNRLGIQLRDADGNLRDVTDVMTEMADPLRDMESNTQRVATTTALMGRSGAALNPLFVQGSEGIAAMRAELEELGGGASPEMIQASADLVDAQARLDLAILSIKTRIASQLLPTFQALVDATREISAWFARNEQALAVFKIALIAVGVVVGILAVALALVLGPVLLGLLVVMSPVILTVTALILVIQDLYVWVQGGDSVIGTFVESLLSLAGINFEGVRLAWRTFMEEIRDGYNTVAEALGLPTISGGTVRDARNLGAKEETPAERRERTAPGEPEAPTFLRQIQAFSDIEQARLNNPRRRRRGISAAVLGAGSRTPQQNITQRTEFNISGTDPQAVADNVRRIMDAQNRDAVEALGQ